MIETRGYECYSLRWRDLSLVSFGLIKLKLLVICLLMTNGHLCMVLHLPSYFCFLEFSLLLIVPTPGWRGIDLISVFLKLNLSGLVLLSSSRSLISLFSLDSSNSCLSRQVSGSWMLIAHLPLPSTSLISHTLPIFIWGVSWPFVVLCPPQFSLL